MPVQSKKEIIAQDIIQKIRFAQYKPGDYLPSEHRLCDLYGTSRETVRKALAQLTSLGLIQKIRGKGSLVLDVQNFTFPISGVVSFKDYDKQQGKSSDLEVLNLSERTSPSTFGGHALARRAASYYVEHLRYIDNVPSVLNQEFLFKEAVPVITKADVANSLYGYLERTLGLNISYSTKEITVERIPDRIANILKLTDDHYAAVVRSMSYLDDTRLFQLTTSYQRPDKFKFIDFERRKNAARS